MILNLYSIFGRATPNTAGETVKMRLSWIFFSTLALAMRGAAGATPPGMAGQIVQSVANGRNQCVVWPRGCGKDDVPNLLKAFNMCNHGGTVVFPENATFWIATRINPILSDVRIEWLGEWLVSSMCSACLTHSHPHQTHQHAFTPTSLPPLSRTHTSAPVTTFCDCFFSRL